MSEHRPFGFDPDDFDRRAREVGDGIRETIGKIGNILGDIGLDTVVTSGAASGMGPGFTTITYPRRRRTTTTAGSGDGVWAVFVVGEDGAATVEQVYATELDALRANKTNTDPRRRVRFLPYGIAVSALDSDRDADSGPDGFTEPDPER